MHFDKSLNNELLALRQPCKVKLLIFLFSLNSVVNSMKMLIKILLNKTLIIELPLPFAIYNMLNLINQGILIFS